MPEGKTLAARADAANVEITISAMAVGFLGTQTSSFSLAIVEERSAIFGKPASSAGEMDKLAPAKEAPAQATLEPVALPSARVKKDEL